MGRWGRWVRRWRCSVLASGGRAGLLGDVSRIGHFTLVCVLGRPGRRQAIGGVAHRKRSGRTRGEDGAGRIAVPRPTAPVCHRAVSRGVPVNDVQAVMGHEKPSTAPEPLHPPVGRGDQRIGEAFADDQRRLTMESARATLFRGGSSAYFDGGRDWDRTSDHFSVKQDAAPTLTCANKKPQAGVGAVAYSRMPFGAVQGCSVHPVAPHLLPRSGPVAGCCSQAGIGRPTGLFVIDRGRLPERPWLAPAPGQRPCGSVAPDPLPRPARQPDALGYAAPCQRHV